MKSVLTALSLAVSAEQPVVEISGRSWAGDSRWKQRYNRVDSDNRDELQRLGEENRRKRAKNKAEGLTR